MSKRLSPHLQQKIPEGAYCEKHLEPLQLFCDDDQIALCAKCLQSQEHTHHMVYGVQEAAENYRRLFREISNVLKEKLEVAKSMLADEQERMVMIQEEEQNFKEMIESEYRIMFRLMIEENEVNFQSLKQCVFNLNLREASLNQLTDFATELSKKSQEMLRNARYSLERTESLLLQCLQPARIADLSLCQITGMSKMLKVLQRPITLDPKTAHPCLVLSEDLRSIRLRNVQQDVPGNPERFDFSATVLGVESFTSGRHYWEVDVGKTTKWQLGIYEDSVSRKSDLPKASADKVLLTGSLMGADFTLWVFPPLRRVFLREQMHKVGVFLDYEYGQISFYDVTKRSLIYNFSCLTFQGALRPIFSLCLPIGGTNSDSLSICLPHVSSCNVTVRPQSSLV
ncbi:probable E3 ubiquitin-protein ligase TRIML2 isoform X2 [Diceros bicornis minor]|uniref:probable E3 ubiquitin-protein ligase TRIML2 isoform X2 n=1 Tax=Diceros bicornis minor TaxID=77932 RepID=UPI0026EF9D2C|nr:probable E3 ubiquitin-protein ligase TRIML2 isoform X2 [Diceros bicornis minor]